MGIIDIAVFVIFVVAVISIGLIKSGKETTSEDYFLAGRGLTWWLVGFSLIAANISTEQFVGMSGKAADWLGMAIASYEWMAAITLVFVAFIFLPKFLKSGIYTIPEFLGYRYNPFTRTIMAISTLIILVGVPTASVIYSGAKVICVSFQGQSMLGLDLGNITVGCWIIGVLATAYVFVGGLKACAWADLIQGAALIIGGAIIAYLAIKALGTADPASLASAVGDVNLEELKDAGAFERLKMLNGGDLPQGKLHMFRGADDPEIPWTALMLGLWIPNFFYWGLNQYITQRTLGSKSLAEGQKGIVFAALLKLIIPFVVVIPGILAFNLFTSDIESAAGVKNAKSIAIYAPNLYDKLSDEVKPDINEPLYVNDIKTIDKLLEHAKKNPSEDVTVFRFSEIFATGHTADAMEIVSYNASMLGVDLTESMKDPVNALVSNTDILDNAAPEKKRNVHELALRDYDAAFPVLIKRLLPTGTGLKGFVLAAIFGAVVSSLASMLNSASTIATMDVYNKVRKGDPSQRELITCGRVCVVLFVLIALMIAPKLGSPVFGGIFTFIQEFQGFISPGILSVFLFGLLIKRAPRMVGTVGLLLNPALYGIFKFSTSIPGLKNIKLMNDIAAWSFLNRMALCLGIIIAVLTVITIVKPLKEPVVMPVNEKMDMSSSKGTKIFGGVVIALTIVLYVIFF